MRGLRTERVIGEKSNKGRTVASGETLGAQRASFSDTSGLN